MTSLLTTDTSDHFVQDSIDKLLSRFDKENEAIRKNKALSELDGGRRERRDGIRPLTNVVSNQVTQLPEIDHSLHHYSEVMAINLVCIKLTEILQNLLTYRKPLRQLPGWMGMAQAPPIRLDSNYLWI